jgi:tetratricopeptide (TPR) repeat protein
MVAARRRSGSATPLFGRSEILEEVARRLDQVRSGTGAGILLVGASGIGKSHLLGRAVDVARDHGFRVLAGRALPEEIPAPFSLLRDLFASEEEDGRPEPSGSDRAGLSLFLAPVVEGETDDGARPGRTADETPRSGVLEEVLAPLGATAIEGLDAVRDEMMARLADRVLARAADRPLLLAVDDLHFADGPSLAFLGRLASELPRARLAILATTVDPVEAPSRSRPALEGLGRAATFRTIPLRPLTVSEVGEFATWILGGHAPSSEEFHRWHAQTDGNPLFVEQLVRTTTGSAAPAAEEAEDVTEMLVRRIDALAENDRRVLTYAAVLGKEFAFAALRAVAGLEEERVTESLDRIVHEGLLREKGDEVYEFVTEAVRANVYAGLTETRRRLLHRKAAVALEADGGASDVELARHFYLGGVDAKAVEWNVKAAEAATRAYDYDAAVAHVARALEAERRRPDRDVRGEVRLLTEEGRLLDDLGHWNRSEEILEEAVGLARAHAGADLELGRALLALAQTQVDRSEYASAEALATEALAGLERRGTPLDLMAASRVLGIVAWRIGDLRKAERHQRAVLDIAEREGTPLQLGHALVDVANTMVPRGGEAMAPALELYNRAVTLFDGAGAESARSRVLMDRAYLEYAVGLVDEAFRDIQEAISAAERSRSPIYLGYCLINMAQWYAELGQTDPARSALERGAAAVANLGDRLLHQQIMMTEGMIAEAEGRYDAAEVHYQEALAKARELHLASETSEMLYRMARLSARRGDRTEARARLDEAVAAGVREHRPDFDPGVEELLGELRTAG